MLSKKMTVSLMSLITIIALAFAVSPAMADNIGIDLRYDEAENVDGRHIDVTIEFSETVALASVQAAEIAITVVYDDFTTKTGTLMGKDATAGTRGLTDDTDTTLDETGLSQVYQKDIDPSTAGGQYDGKTFTFRILSKLLLRKGLAADGTADANQTIGTTKVYVSVPAGISGLNPGHTHMTGATPVHALNASPRVLDIPIRTVASTMDRDTPQVVSIQRLRPGSQTVVAAFQEAAVTGPFQVRIVLSETPHEPNKFHEKIDVANGEKSGFVVGTPFARHGALYTADPDSDGPLQIGDPDPGKTIRPHPVEGRYNHDGVITAAFGDTGTVGTNEYAPLIDAPEGLDEVHVPLPTGTTDEYWQCRITISPHRRATSVTIKIKEFRDAETPPSFYYPHQVDRKPNGREQLHLPVALEQFDLQDGRQVKLPHTEKAKITYANSTPGHYILATNKAGSHIKYYYHEDTSTPPRENRSLEQTPAELLYNVRQSTALPNLETFLINNGTIHLVSYDGTKYKAGDAYISEVMWGTDAIRTLYVTATGLRSVMEPPLLLRLRKICGDCGSMKRTRHRRRRILRTAIMRGQRVRLARSLT